MNKIKLISKPHQHRNLISTRHNRTYIKVLQPQLIQRIIQRRLHILGLVLVIPQLGGEEDVLALQAGDLCKGLLDALAGLLLVAVDLGEVDVAVADLEGLVDALADFAGGGLPGAVAQEGDLVARVEGCGLA